MLLGNYNVFNKNPGRAIGGPTDPTIRYKAGSVNNFYTGDAEVSGETDKAAFPNGYVPPYTWVTPPKAGGLGSVNEISGTGALSISSLALGKACESTIAGTGTLTPPSLSLLVQLAAAILGSGTVSAPLQASLSLASSLAGSGDLAGALGAIAFCVSAMTGTGAISATLRGTATLEADIQPFTELSPQALASAVWSALAASFDEAGTMGEKLNSASSAGDPWSTALPGAYADGTAGKIVGQKLLTTGKFIVLK